jgi:hypothetical protein
MGAAVGDWARDEATMQPRIAIATHNTFSLMGRSILLKKESPAGTGSDIHPYSAKSARIRILFQESTMLRVSKKCHC